MASASTCSHYVIALGSNQRHARHGNPAQTLTAAITALAEAHVIVEAVSQTLGSAPIGPSLRRYANAAALIATPLSPPALLALLKQIERQFGRRRGQRWGSRVLDLDIILWRGGRWSSPALTIPHHLWRQRTFVIDPVCAIAPDWRDPVTHLSVRQLASRLRKPRPMTSNSNAA